MLLCTKCWSITCSCKCNKVEIDNEIADIISVLNQKKYRTLWCCGGHINKEYLRLGIFPSIYVMFNKYCCGKIDPIDIGEGWKFQKTDCILRYQCSNNKLLHSDRILSNENLFIMAEELSKKQEELRVWAFNL